ncbi:hypothetical protein AAHC03_0444 [Spirometra sp. Aus1]
MPADQWNASDIHNENPPVDAQPSSKSKRHVRFPEDDSLVVGYLDPFVPTSDNCTSDELISAYIASCKYYKVAPIDFLLEQLKGIDLSICNERYSRLSLKGVRFSRLQVETLEEVFRRVHFREIDLEEAYLDEPSATALFDIMLYYESCIDLSITFSVDRTLPSTAWQRCVAFLRKSSALRFFKLSHTPLAVHHFMGLNLSGLSLEKICFRDCNLSGAVLFELVRWLRYLMTLTESSSAFLGTRSGDRVTTAEGSQKPVRNGSRRYPRLSLRGPQVPGLWALSLHLPENRITSVDAETLLSLIRHQLVILPGPPTPCKARNGLTDDSPDDFQVENRPIGGSGYLVELNLAQNNFRDEGVNILCTGLLQAYRMQQRRLEVATAAIAEATEGKKTSKPPKSPATEDTESTDGSAGTEGEPSKPSVRLKLPPSCALPSVRGLERLCLSDNGLTPLSARDLAHVVAQSTERMAPLIGGLTHLDLSNNPGLGDEGVEVLCEGLIKNCTLRELILRNVRMGFGGIFALSGYLGESKSLVLLDIRQNSIDLAGVMALAKTMTINESLTSLLSDARNPFIPVASKDAGLMQTFLADLDNCLRRNRHSALKQKLELPSEGAVQLATTNSGPAVHNDEMSAVIVATDDTDNLSKTDDHPPSENKEDGAVEDASITADSSPSLRYQSQSPDAPNLFEQCQAQLPDQLIKGREECEVESQHTNPSPLYDDPSNLANSEGDQMQAEEELISSPPSSHWPPLTVDEYEDYVSSDPLRLLEEGTSPVLNGLQSLEEVEHSPSLPSLPVLLDSERDVGATLPFALSTDTRAKVRRISEISSAESPEDDSPQLSGDEEEIFLAGSTEEQKETVDVAHEISQALNQGVPPLQFGFGPDATAPRDLAPVAGLLPAEEVENLQSSSEGNKSPDALRETPMDDSSTSNQCSLPSPSSLTQNLITIQDPSLNITTAEMLAGETSNVTKAPYASQIYSDVYTEENELHEVSESVQNHSLDHNGQADASNSAQAPVICAETEFHPALPDSPMGSDSTFCGTYHAMEPVSSVDQPKAPTPILKTVNCHDLALDASKVDGLTSSLMEKTKTQEESFDHVESALTASSALDSSCSNPSPDDIPSDYRDHMIDGTSGVCCLDNPPHPLTSDDLKQSLIKDPTQDVDLTSDQRTPPGEFQASTSLVGGNIESVSDKVGQLSIEIDKPIPMQGAGESSEKTREEENSTLCEASGFTGALTRDNKGGPEFDRRSNCSVMEAAVALDRMESVANLDEDLAGNELFVNVNRNEYEGSFTSSDGTCVRVEPITEPKPDVQQFTRPPLVLNSSFAEDQKDEGEQAIVEGENSSLVSAVDPSHHSGLNADSNLFEETSARPSCDAGSFPTDGLPDRSKQTLNNAYASVPRPDNTIGRGGYLEEHWFSLTPVSDVATKMSAEPVHSADQSGRKNVVKSDMAESTEELFSSDLWPQSGEAGGEPLTSSSNAQEMSQLKKGPENQECMTTDSMLVGNSIQQLPCTPSVSNPITVSSEADTSDKDENPALDTRLSFTETAFASSEPSVEACVPSRHDTSHRPTDPAAVLGPSDLRTLTPPFEPKHNRTSAADSKEFPPSPLSLHGVCSMDGDCSTPPHKIMNPTLLVNPPVPDSWEDENWGDFESDEPQLSTEFGKDLTQMSLEFSNTSGSPSTVCGHHSHPVSTLPDEVPDPTTGKTHVD